MDNKSVLWISGISWLKDDGTYFPDADYPGAVSASAFQQAIIEGLEDYGSNVLLLSDCDMSSGKRIEWSHNSASRDIRVGGNGNKFLRIPTKIINLFKEIKKGDILQNVDYVCAYEMHLPYLLSLRKIKKIKPEIKTVLICPDLPLYTDLDLKKKPIKSFLKKIENIVVKRILKYVDGYIFFTEQMQEYFAKYNKSHIVVEGVYRDKYPLNDVEKKHFIMHAGSLHYNVGIEELIEAFEKISDEKAELWFFGSGALDNYIKDKAKNNDKIKHMGFVDPQKLFEYEKQATLLVNVRDPRATYTKYSFPSKTFEYMASGTPFLTTDLPGIPEEYKPYLVIIDDNSIGSISDGITKCLSMTDDERMQFGLAAREFVLNHKNKTVQSKKVLDYLLTL